VPPGTTAGFDPVSVLAPGHSAMTVRTTLRTPRGTFALTVTGQSGAMTRHTTATLIVR
jgi:hypothetical protein